MTLSVLIFFLLITLASMAGKVAYSRDSADRKRLAATSRRRRAENVVILVGTAAACLAGFGYTDRLPLSFVLLGWSVLVATLISWPFVLLHNCVVTVIAVRYTLDGSGPFAHVTEPIVQVAIVLLFLALVIVVGLALALGRDERAALVVALARGKAELVTEQERTAAHSALLAAIIDTMAGGLMVVEPDGYVSLRNPAATELLGPFRNIRNTGFRHLHLDGTPYAIHERLSTRAMGGENVRGEDVLVQQPGTGHEHIVRVNASPLPRPDGTCSAVVLVHDVTAERRHRDELTKFAGVVAHDLLNPLACFCGWTAAARDSLSDLPPHPGLDQALDDLARSDRAAARMRELIDGQLAYATAHKGEVSPVPVDLTALAADIAVARSDSAVAVGEPEPRFTVGDLPPVQADPVLLRQLMDNVIGNAIKYTSPGTAPALTITASRTGDTVMICIADNGIGIPPGQHEAIFENFHRAHPDSGYHGTGLGLAICKRIVERHGGTIAASDNPGGGSCFTFTLPAAAATAGGPVLARARRLPAGDRWHKAGAAGSQRAARARAAGTRLLKDACRAGGEIALDLRLRRADGVYRWFRLLGAPARDDHGRPVKWFGAATEIDEREAAEPLDRAQQEAVTLLETVQSCAPIGWGFGDREFRYVRVNERLAAINGVPAEDHAGRQIAEVVPDYWPHIEPVYRRVLETGEPASHRAVTAATTAGPARWQVNYYPLRVAGELVGVGFVVVDLTEITAAEAFRAAVMDHMAEGLFTTDDEGRVNSVNRAATEMLGWTENKLMGRSLHDVVHSAPDGNGHSAQECPLAVSGADGEQAGDCEDRYVRNDGSVLEVAHSVSPLPVGAPVAGTVVVFRDITDLKQRQRLQIEGSHHQKLEALGRLSAGLAHEINTPIQFVGDNTRFLAEACQTMLELLLVYRECMGVDSEGRLPWEERKRRAQEAEAKADIEYLAEEVPGAVEQSLEGIDRVASLVRAMKAFSYKDTTEHSYADLNEGIRTTVIVARNEVKYVADVVLDLGELPDVLCNLGDLNKVFLNLLVNAADAMPEGGKRGEIKLTTRVEGPMVVLSFADNGTGIPEEIRKTIFDPFFTTKEVGKGTGQGLALARAVCEKHGGTIEVNSEVGVGTEFVLRLPISGKRGGPA